MTATVTVLCTDVVGPGLDDRYRRAEEAHRRILAEAAGAHDGELFRRADGRTAAVFTSTAAAVRAGLALCRAAAALPGPPIVRAAVATGEAARTGVGEWTGTPVLLAVGLCALADPGQLLAPATVATLLEYAGEDFVFTDVGRLEVPGLARPVAACEIAPAAPTVPDSPLPLLLRMSEPFPFVHRPRAWEVLDEAWTRAAAGGREMVLIGGEAGVGKTRLVSEFARHARRQGAVLAHGGCAEPALTPYQPFAEAFGEYVAALSPEARQDLAGCGAAALAHLVPALPGAVDLPGGPQPGEGEADAARYRLYQAVTAALRWMGRAGPVLLVLEDLHWAGPTTMDLLQALLRGSAPGRLCLLATYRSTPADASAAFRAGLGELRRGPGVGRVLLEGFDHAEVRSFVQGASGHAMHLGLEPIVDVLSTETSGNPLLLGEFWRHLVDDGHLVRPQGRWRIGRPLAGLASPDGVQEIVLARLERLPQSCRDLLSTAAVIGTSFDVPLLAAVTGLDSLQVLGALEPALGAGLVNDLGAGTCRFTHAVVGRAIHDTTLLAARTRAHAAIAAGLTQRHGSAAVAEVAHHLLAALPLGEPASAVAAGRAAARAAGAQVAHAEAARFLEAVLPIVAEGPERGEILLELAGAATLAGDAQTAQARSLEAVELGRRLRDDDLVVSAALALADANWRTSGDRAQVLQVLAAALPIAPPGPVRSRLTAMHGRALALAGQADAAHAAIRAAVAQARELGDGTSLATALEAQLFLPWTPDTLDEQLAAAREAIALGRSTDRPAWTTHALDRLIYGTIYAGNLDEARRLAGEHHTLTIALAQPLFRVLDHQLHALLALGAGRFAEAEALAAASAEFGRFLSDETTAGGYGVLMFGIRREQGRLEEARPMVEAVTRLGHEGETWRPALAVLYAELGMAAEAARELDALADGGLARIPRDSLWVAALSYLADAATITAHARIAPLLYEHLKPHQGLVVQVGHFLGAYGAADRYLGMMAVLMGRDRAAEQHFEAALRIDTRAQMPVWVARTHLAFGRFLAGRSDRASLDRAQSLLGIAADTAERIPLPVLAAAASEELTRLRAARSSRAVAAAAGTAGLTDRELTILALLVGGRSNRAIGEHLHISHHTAANHVRAILIKTGCANRTEAAAWAVRNGLATP